MKAKLALILAVGGLLSVKIESPLQEATIVPLAETYLRPFTIISAGVDSNTKLTLSITCSQFLKMHLLFPGGAESLCNIGSKTDSIESINRLMSTWYAILSREASINSEETIDYALSDEKGTSLFEFTTKVSAFAAIPVTPGNLMVFTSLRDPQLILFLDLDFTRRFPVETYTIESSPPLPKSISTQMGSGSVRLVCGSSLSSTLDLKITIKDKKSGLMSLPLTVSLLPAEPGSGSKIGSSSSNKFFIVIAIIAFLILLIIIGFVVRCVIRRNKYSNLQQMEVGTKTMGTTAATAPKTFGFSTRSIIDYNKRLASRLIFGKREPDISIRGDGREGRELEIRENSKSYQETFANISGILKTEIEHNDSCVDEIPF